MAEHFFYFGTKMGRNSPKTSRMWDAGNSRIEGQSSVEETVRADLKTKMINMIIQHPPEDEGPKLHLLLMVPP